MAPPRAREDTGVEVRLPVAKGFSRDDGAVFREKTSGRWLSGGCCSALQYNIFWRVYPALQRVPGGDVCELSCPPGAGDASPPPSAPS